MKNLISNTLILGLSSILTMSCAQKGAPGQISGERNGFTTSSAPGSNARDVSPGNPAGSAVGGTSRGTLDGGGGNGINGKPIESYRVNIRDLPEYKKFVEPFLKAYKQSMAFQMPLMIEAVLNKNWYFVPVSLDKVPQKILGAPFHTDQIAVQNLSEVYVDTSNYRGDEISKADLIFHEIAMGLRLLRFASPYNQCVAENGPSRLYQQNDQTSPPMPYPCAIYNKAGDARKIELTDADYESVRLAAKAMQDARDAMIKAQDEDVKSSNHCVAGECPVLVLQRDLNRKLRDLGFNTPVIQFYEEPPQFTHIKTPELAKIWNAQSMIFGKNPDFRLISFDDKDTGQECSLDLTIILGKQDGLQGVSAKIKVGKVEIEFDNNNGGFDSIYLQPTSKYSDLLSKIKGTEIHDQVHVIRIDQGLPKENKDTAFSAKLITYFDSRDKLIGFAVEQNALVGTPMASSGGTNYDYRFYPLDSSNPRAINGFCRAVQ